MAFSLRQQTHVQIKLTMKISTVFLLSLTILSCSPYKAEIEIANIILSDKKIVSKKIDLIDKASANLDSFDDLDIYLRYKKIYNNESRYMGINFKFQKGYDFIFSEDDITFIRQAAKKDFSWKNKIRSANVTLLSRPIYQSENEEATTTVARIKMDRPLSYMSKPYFNKVGDKAIVAFYTVCKLCNHEYYFLIKENKEWKIIGQYTNEML
jgi:hypothetical protein